MKRGAGPALEEVQALGRLRAAPAAGDTIPALAAWRADLS